MLTEKRGKLLLNIGIWVFMLFHVLYTSFWGTQKMNYHVDEYYTYGLSNNRGSIWPTFENGVSYKGSSVFLNYLTPDESERFDYSIVWDNQANDVHPPLYYTIIHTISSIFPHTFSKWVGLSVNIFLILVVNLLVFLIGKLLFYNSWAAFCAMVINGLTLLTINTVLFLRMYVLMAVFVLGITALFLKYWRRPCNWKFYTMLLAISVGGALTQYYFLIYLFFLCLAFGLALILTKKWKDLLYFVMTLGGAGCISVVIFPAMLEQIFGSGYRGQQAFENATTFSDVPKHLLAYLQILNKEIFGGYIVLIALFILSYLIILLCKKEVSYTLLKLCLFLVPTILYCIAIAIIAPYQYNRYVMAMGPLLVLGAFWFLFHVVDEVFQKRKILFSNAVVTGIFLMMAYSSMSLSNWTPEYTYQSTAERLENATAYSDYRVLYVNIAAWAVNDNMQELIKYKDFTFIDEAQLTDYIRQWKEKSLILYAPSGMDVSNIANSVQPEKAIHIKPLYENKHPDFASVYFVDFGGR